MLSQFCNLEYNPPYLFGHACAVHHFDKDSAQSGFSAPIMRAEDLNKLYLLRRRDFKCHFYVNNFIFSTKSSSSTEINIQHQKLLQKHN
jgi:hypothetical protein